MTIDAVAEILTQPERRRRWTSEQKLALVAETLRPGASPTQIARRYGISTGLLYTWRRLAREGELSLVPVSGYALLPSCIRRRFLIQIDARLSPCLSRRSSWPHRQPLIWGILGPPLETASPGYSGWIGSGQHERP
jgi:hypothetical protein